MTSVEWKANFVAALLSGKLTRDQIENIAVVCDWATDEDPEELNTELCEVDAIGRGEKGAEDDDA